MLAFEIAFELEGRNTINAAMKPQTDSRVEAGFSRLLVRLPVRFLSGCARFFACFAENHNFSRPTIQARGLRV